MTDDLKKLAEAAPMADVEKVARAICRADKQDPDRLIHYRDIQVSSTREPYPAWRNYIKQAEAALAAMGEREAVGYRYRYWPDAKWAYGEFRPTEGEIQPLFTYPPEAKVIKVGITAHKMCRWLEGAGQPTINGDIMHDILARALGVENWHTPVVKADISASPRPEAVEEIAAIAESLRQAYPMEASRILILLGKAQPAAIRATEESKG